MKIQATQIEAGQTIKVASIWTTEEKISYYQKKLSSYIEDDYYQGQLAKAEADKSKSILGELKTSGKHNLEYTVLEVKEYASYSGVCLGNRTLGSNYALLVTDKGSFLIPNRNKVTLVD